MRDFRNDIRGRGASSNTDNRFDGLRVRLEPFETQHDAGAIFAQAGGDPRDLGHRRIRRLHHDMAIGAGERDEIALGIDHHLLHLPRRSFEQPAQQM